MANYALMGNDISNAAGNGPPNFPFGLTQPTTSTPLVKDLANGATYTITNVDGFNYFTSSVALGASKGFILPLAANNVGRRLMFKRTDSSGNSSTGGNGFLFTITTQGSDIIESSGNSSTSLVSSGAWIELIAESPNTWRAIGSNDFLYVINSVNTAMITAGTTANLPGMTMTIPSGEWELQVSLQTAQGFIRQLVYGISTTSGSLSGLVWGETMFNVEVQAVTQIPYTATANLRIKISTPTIYYLVYTPQYSATSPTFTGTKFYARRWG